MGCVNTLNTNLKKDPFSDSTAASTTLPSVKARVRPTSPRLKPFVVEEPVDSKFKPPSAEDIRTIYVPIENAINVPEHFDIRFNL